MTHVDVRILTLTVRVRAYDFELFGLCPIHVHPACGLDNHDLDRVRGSSRESCSEIRGFEVGVASTIVHQVCHLHGECPVIFPKYCREHHKFVVAEVDNRCARRQQCQLSPCLHPMLPFAALEQPRPRQQIIKYFVVVVLKRPLPLPTQSSLLFLLLPVAEAAARCDETALLDGELRPEDPTARLVIRRDIECQYERPIG